MVKGVSTWIARVLDRYPALILFFVSLLLNLDRILGGSFASIRVHDVFDQTMIRFQTAGGLFARYGLFFWDPTSAGGGVFLVSAMVGVWHFMYLFSQAVPLWLSYGISQIAITFVTLYGMYMLLREILRVSPVSSFLGSMLFLVVQLGRSTDEGRMLWYGLSYGFPFYLYCFHRLSSRELPSIRSWYGLVLLLFLIHMHPATVLPFFPILHFAVIIGIFPRREWGRNLLYAGLVWCVYAAVHLPSLYLMIRESPTSHRSSWDLSSSLNLAGALQQVWTDYVVLPVRTKGALTALFPLWLAVTAVVIRRKERVLRFWLLLLVALFAGLAFERSVIYAEWRDHLGFLKGFQFSRFFQILGFVFCLLASLGIESLRQIRLQDHRDPGSSSPVLTASLIGAVVLFGCGLWARPVYFGEVVFYYLPLLLAALILSCLAKRGAVSRALLLLSVAGLLFVGLVNFRLAGLKQWEQTSFASFVPEQLREEWPERVTAEPSWTYRVASLGLYPAQMEAIGLETADGYQNMYSQRYKDFWAKVVGPALGKSRSFHDYFMGWGSRVYLFNSAASGQTNFTLECKVDLLAMLNTKFLVSKRPAANPEADGLSLVYDSRPVARSFTPPPWLSRVLPASYKFEEPEIFVYSIKHALPRTFIVHRWNVLNDPDEVLAAVSEAGAGRLAREAFLCRDEIPAGHPSSRGSRKSKPAEIVRFAPDSIAVSTQSEELGILVYNGTYHRNWTAKVNGAPARVFPVDCVLMGVLVPAGASTVNFDYCDPVLGKLYGISGVTLACVAVAPLILLISLRMRQDKK